ncbi:hypothetical protein JCM10212_005790 [Sporobolomyces blumeae]
MLTWTEVASKGFGWIAFWGATVLFFPEILHAGIHRPRQLRFDTYVFYWCWWIGDGCQLIGLQILIAMLTTFACCMRPHNLSLFINPKATRNARNDHERALDTLVRATSTHPSFGAPPSAHHVDDSQPPPGTSSLADEIMSLSGNESPKKGMRRKIKLSAAIWNGIGVFIIVAIVWTVEDVVKRDTAHADPVAKMPTTTIEKLAYYIAYAGIPLWVGPRLLNIYVSLTSQRKEGITTEAVLLGGGSHVANIVSILLVSRTDDARNAQAPFIATAAACVSIDIIRLVIKFVVVERRTKPGHRGWLADQDRFAYDNGAKGEHRYGPTHGSELSSSGEESDGPLRSVDSKHRKKLASRALLPFPPRNADPTYHLEDVDPDAGSPAAPRRSDVNPEMAETEEQNRAFLTRMTRNRARARWDETADLVNGSHGSLSSGLDELDVDDKPRRNKSKRTSRDASRRRGSSSSAGHRGRSQSSSEPKTLTQPRSRSKSTARELGQSSRSVSRRRRRKDSFSDESSWSNSDRGQSGRY